MAGAAAPAASGAAHEWWSINLFGNLTYTFLAGFVIKHFSQRPTMGNNTLLTQTYS